MRQFGRLALLLFSFSTIFFAVIAPSYSDTDLQRQFRDLRDEAIRHVGWVAGNSKKHPIWPQVEPLIGPEGIYYEVTVRMAVPGADHETESMLNVGLHDEWFEKGQEVPFNEAEALRRIQRTQQIVGELEQLLDRFR